jgi:teichuronic acid biosynthesis glycosyltransferase TuaC
MRILFLSSTFPRPSNPTAGAFNLNLCRALALEHEVRVICPWSWLERLRYWIRRKQPDRDATRLLAGLDVSYATYFYPPKVFRQHYGTFLWASSRRVLRRTMAGFRPDVVVSYWIHPEGEVGARVAKSRGVPSAVIVGGSDVMLLPHDPRRRKRIVAVLQNTDAVVTVGEDLKRRVVGLGIPADKVFVWPQGIDTGVFHSGDRDQARRQLGIAADGAVLVSVGRLVPVKGVEVLLKAAARLKERGVRFRLFLIGDGPLRGDLQNQAVAMGLADHVQFVGATPQSQLPDWYRAADLTVLSSHSEGVPNVLRESIACGTPFVATQVGGVCELAEEGHDRLVPANDPGALADAIEQSLSASRPSQSRRFEPESWHESANHLVQILRDVRDRAKSNGSQTVLQTSVMGV